MEKFVQSDSNLSFQRSYNHTPSFYARSAFFYIQSAGHFKCDKSYSIQREGYKSFLIIYTISGKGYLKYRGREFEASKDRLFILDCNEYQQYYTDKTQLWEMKWVHFYGATSHEYFNKIYENCGSQVDMSGHPDIDLHIDTVFKLFDDNDLHLEIKASSILVQILTKILLAVSVGNDGNKKSSNAQVEAALEFIERRYFEDISLSSMAKAACCSNYHFIRLFSKITGFSPYEYLIKFRINKAKNLLKTSIKTVEEISREVGFGSTSGFIKTFKELEGMTPLKYRKFWEG